MPIISRFERWMRSNDSAITARTPSRFGPLAAQSRESLGLPGREEYAIVGVEDGEAREEAVREDDREFRARVRLDTPREREYVRHGGILPYVLRKLLD